MKTLKVGVVSLLAAILPNLSYAKGFDNAKWQFYEFPVSADYDFDEGDAGKKQVVEIRSLEAGGATPTLAASKLECKFWPKGGKEVKLGAPVNLTPKRSGKAEATSPVGNLTVTLTSEGGDGGEPGTISLSIAKGNTIIFRTLWQASDFIVYPGLRSGLHSVNAEPGNPSSAELHFSCETK